MGYNIPDREEELVQRPRGERKRERETGSDRKLPCDTLGGHNRRETLESSSQETLHKALWNWSRFTSLGSTSALSPLLVGLPWPVSHRSKNPAVSPLSSLTYPTRLLIRLFLISIPKMMWAIGKALHTINEPGVTDPNLRLTPLRMFPLRIFISSEDMCGQSMLFSDL